MEQTSDPLPGNQADDPPPTRVQLPKAGTAADTDALEREREALRIQAAAVAAQQAALMEEEIRLQQRRVALEQQEQQLAAHLEAKRQKLVTLRDEAHEAHSALQQVRAAYEQRVAQIMGELVHSRREVADNQRQAQAERRRLLDLRQRLKRRFHRHWAGERMAMRLREAEVDNQRRELAKEKERLEQEKAGLMRLRMRCNGDVELGRRQLQAGRDQLHKEQRVVEERTGALDQREAALAKMERNLAGERRQWEGIRLHLQQEAQGLESRVANYRRKILDQEQELNRLKGALGDTPNRQTFQATPAAAPDPPPQHSPASVPLPLGNQGEQRAGQPPQSEATLQGRLVALRQLADELADQRLYLAEQYERLALAQQQWQQDRETAVTELEAVGQQLHDWEQAIQVREHALGPAEHSLRQRSTDIAQRQTHLDGCASRLAASAAVWEGERDRLLASVRLRENLVAQRLAALTDLRERWGKRCQRQVLQLQAQRAVYEALRREGEALRQESLHRSTHLGKEQRALAERALALEQYRQEWIARAANPKAAEKRLERFRRRWVALFASTERALAQERKALETQVTVVETRSRQLQQHVGEINAREAELSSRQAAWEQKQLQEQAEQDKVRQELYHLRGQRQAYERQLESLRDEVERLARLLLDEDDPAPLPVVQAA